MLFLFIALFFCFCAGATWEIAAFSLAVSAALFAFCCRYLGYSPEKEKRFLRLVPGIAAYFFFLLGEIIRANLRLLRFIYSQKYVPEPCIVTFETSLRSRILRTVLADSITLTPGTITLETDGCTLRVHCLDKTMAEGLKCSLFEKRLSALESARKEEEA